ncbi:MAG: hypothetical protein REH83_02580 [Rickettsiella sp.]|nr:hypothetical protein [Rickettsiella sp.]
MSQTVILNKFIRYLELKKKEIKSQYDPILIDKLIEDFKNGHCFGFALCYAAMALAGRLGWWRAMLVKAYYWDGSPIALSKSILMPGSLEKKPIRLKEIFERLIHYIAFHQLDTTTCDFLTVNGSWSESHYKSALFVPSLDFKNISQINILGADIKYFEFVNEIGQIKQIQVEADIHDKFIIEELSYLFKSEIIKTNIYLILSHNHAIAVMYDKEYWGVYDPNYSHDSVLSLDKLFSNTTEVSKEVLRILGKEITIKLASLEERDKIKLFNWKTKFEIFKEELINDAYQILLNLENNNLDFFSIPVEELKNVFHFSQKDEKLANLICQLVYSNKYMPVFFNFLLENPSSLFDLFKISKKSEIYFFVKFLFAKNDQAKTTIEVVQKVKPKKLTAMLMQIMQSLDACKAFFSQILLRNMEDIEFFKWSRLLDMQSFLAILAIIENSSGGIEWLATQLVRSSVNTGEVGIQIFWENGDKKKLPFLLELIDKLNNETGAATLLVTLKSYIIRTNQSVFRYLISDGSFSEQYFFSMLKIISKSDKQLCLFYQWLALSNEGELTPIEEIFFLKPICFNYILTMLENPPATLSDDDLEKILRLINKLVMIHKPPVVEGKKTLLLDSSDLLFFKDKPFQRPPEDLKENKHLNLKMT